MSMSIEQTTINSKWLDIRRIRDSFMMATDWTQMPDAPLSESKKTEFTTYRQILRDIPQTYDNPDDIIWPAMPTL